MVIATTIAIYGSPPSNVCSTPHQITASDLDLTSRNLSTSPSSSLLGGLSSLFSGASLKADDFSSLRHDRSEDYKDLSFTSSFCYSPSRFVGSSYHRRDHQSPISVLHGPVSSSCSPPMRSFHGSLRAGGGNGLFSRFVRKAVGSCVDYELGSSSSDELTFPMEDGEDTRQPYARNLLRRAQLRHKIFEDEAVIKAFYEAEKAHRGQVELKTKPFILVFAFLVFD